MGGNGGGGGGACYSSNGYSGYGELRRSSRVTIGGEEEKFQIEFIC